ncbi:YcxB family protein [Rhizobium lemnae]|uniref:YcxB family protein n=1 Tax=Rhizobium lemnae TaxID=1214924 RepID=A0ABV8EDT1_9HYPH|nr:YcxB family protein [Rhizobium lemnae]MCJ8510000.1 YcxB family protein [Rhizobium lemnae]
MKDTKRSVTLTLTADDYVAANKLFILKHATSRGTLIWWLLFVALLFLGSIFVPALSPRNAPFGVLFCVGGAIVIVLPFFQYFFGASIFARKAYAAQKTLQHPMTVEWSEEGLRSTAQQGDWNIPWDDYLKWAEDDKVLLLYQGPRVFNMIPRR